MKAACVFIVALGAGAPSLFAQFVQVQSYTCANLGFSYGLQYCTQELNDYSGAMRLLIQGDCTNNYVAEADQGYRWGICTYKWDVRITSAVNGTTSQPNPNGPGEVEATLVAYGPTPISYPINIFDYGWSWKQCDSIGDTADAEGGEC